MPVAVAARSQAARVRQGRQLAGIKGYLWPDLISCLALVSLHRRLGPVLLSLPQTSSAFVFSFFPPLCCVCVFPSCVRDHRYTVQN